MGGFVGLVLAYLTRPSAFLVGQLPFGVVITRGVMLRGLEQLLVPVARESFNHLLTGGIAGAVLGGLIWLLLFHRNHTDVPNLGATLFNSRKR